MINKIHTLYIFLLFFTNIVVKGAVNLEIKTLVKEFNLFEPIPFLMEVKNNTNDDLTFELSGINTLGIVQISFDNRKTWSDLYEDDFGNPNDTPIFTLKKNQRISRTFNCFIKKINEKILLNKNQIKVFFRIKISLFGQRKEVFSKSLSSVLHFGELEKKIYYDNKIRMY